MKMGMSFENYLPDDLLKIIKNVIKENHILFQEVRLRTNRNVSLVFANEIIKLAYIPDKHLIENIVMQMCNNSVYAFTDDIANGFITLPDGHRVGIVGKTVIKDGQVKYIRDVSSINIRVARQVLGCANESLAKIVELNGQTSFGEVKNTLIVSPPQCGKTTLLRDITRQISDGATHLNLPACTVGLVDERGEIAACCGGVPQHAVGDNTDVVTGCPKQHGMELLLRSMSPTVIVTDEIGNDGDCAAVCSVLNAGVKVIATAHGYDANNCKSEVKKMIEQGCFEKVIVLSGRKGPGTIESVQQIG